jgi:hypothetical protein
LSSSPVGPPVETRDQQFFTERQGGFSIEGKVALESAENC